jgi:hypothetical protein
MCLSMMMPQTPKIQPLPPAPSKDDPEAIRMREAAARRLRQGRGRASTQLSGSLGDVNYGMNISRATVLGGTTT